MLNSKFPDTLWFVVIFGMFWRNFTTIREICIHVPYKFAQSGYIPPKVKFRISNPRRLPYTQTWVKYPPPRDSGEESCSQPALTLTLILSYMYFLQGNSNAPDLQQMPRLSKGFGQTKSLCRFRQGFFSFLDKWSYFFFIWAGCFSFSLSKDSFSVDFSIGVSVKSFHATTEFLSCIKFVMIY